MGGGVIQLVATGIPDLYLTGDPQITWFKVLYRRYTEFSMVDYPIKINGDPQPGDMHMINIGPIADKLNRVCLVVDVPTPEVEMSPPTVGNIQQITDKYGLTLNFTPPKKTTDTVTYEDLFNDDPQSVGAQITDLTNTLNTKYESRLDILSYMDSTYSVSKDRYLGHHIAMEASGINFKALGENIDMQGYVLLTPEKTRELYHSTTKVIDLNEDSFMYYPVPIETSTFSVESARAIQQTPGHIGRSVIQSITKKYHDSSPMEFAPSDTVTGSTVTKPVDSVLTDSVSRELFPSQIPASDLSTPIGVSIPPIPTRLPTINNMMKVYPRFVNGYTQIAQIQDLMNITDIDTKRYHVMVSIDFLRRVQKRNIYIRRLYLNSLDVAGATTDVVNQYLEQIKDTNLSDITQLSALFNNFNYNEAVTDNPYETGIYLFEVDPSVTDADYPTALTAVLDTGRLEIPIKFIDKALQTQPLPATQTPDTTGVFNRYNINENAIYDPTWEITGQPSATSPVIDLDGEAGKGFFMLNVEELDNDPSNQHVIDLITVGQPTSQITEQTHGQTSVSGVSGDTMVRFNPRFIHCNTDRLGFAPHTLNRVWVNSIVKTVQVKDPTNPNTIVTKQIKVENLLDGVTTIVKLFEDLYTIPNIANSTNLAAILAGTRLNVASLYFLHSLLIAMQEDILNTQTQARNYNVRDITLYNSIDIKSEIYDKLIRDIIYVDQRKLGYRLDQSLSPFTRRQVFNVNSMTGVQTETSDAYSYIISGEYIYDMTNPSDPPTPEAMVSNRNLVYELTKYIMWTYYLENIYPVYDPILNNQSAVADFISELSYMLIQVSKNPIGTDPTDPSGTGVDDPTTKNIRFASHDVNDITRCFIYDDQSIIEAYDVLDKATTQSLASSVYDYQYIYASQRYGESKEPDDQTYPLTNGVTTCINREIEFYHVINSFKHDNIATNDTVYNYFMGLITAAYNDPRNYQATISFKTAQKYLSNYFNDTFVQDSSIAMLQINSEILALIVKNLNFTLLNYIKIVFGVWKNSTYSDTDVNPQYSFNNQLGNNVYVSNIDYGANYVLNYLRQLAFNNVITADQITELGDPLLLRARQFVGANSGFRPFMGFSFQYQIDYTDPTTYTTEQQIIINNSNFINDTDSLIQGSDFKDIFADHIDTQVTKVKYDMEQLARNNPIVRNNMEYILWRDFNQYMLLVVENLNADLQIPADSQLAYYYNTMILNHIPVAITYYYGEYLQYAMQTQYLSGTISEDIEIVENIDYTLIPIEDETDTNNRRFDVEPDPILGLYLQFLGTDVRLDPKCPFHGHINMYSDVQTLDTHCLQYLRSDDLSFVQNMCPICFRTFEFKRLFNMILYRSLLSPVTSTPTFVDDANISLLRPNGFNLPTGATALNLNNGANIVHPDYTAYIHRPEDVIYDDVSKSYFHIITEFAIYRMAAIFFRYAHMIENILDMDQTTFTSFITTITPSGSQIGPANPITGKTEADRFNDFVQYLQGLRSGNLKNSFTAQMNTAIGILTQTNNKPADFAKLQQIYDVSGSSDPVIGEASTYTVAQTFIGNKADLSSGLESFTLVPNVVYDKTDVTLSGANLVRYQMYRGNIVLWVLIQHAIINSYNEFFNNVLDPRQINSNNALTGTTVNVDPDLYTEVYTLLRESIDPQYVNANGTIDYYRSKQTREYPTTVINSTGVVTNDLNSSICTKAMNYCRQLMIFYNMLLARYKKMSFLLTSVQNTSLNSDAYYFNFSQDITEAYLADAITTIKGMKIFSVNPEKNQNINNKFYYLDTSDYFFVDPTTFRNLQINEGDPAYESDYQLFDTSNNYHLSEGFTLNKMTNLMRIVGIHDDKLTPYQDVPDFTNQTNVLLYHDKIGQGLTIDFNDNFQQYFTFDDATGSLNNFEKYIYANSITFDPSTGFAYSLKIYRIINGGLLNRIWYYYPTISNILYDQFYTPVVLQSQVNNSMRSNYYDFMSVTDRTYTKCLVTSPLVYLRDKMSNSIVNKHNHTTNMVAWEDTFHADNSSGIDPSNPSAPPTIRQSRINETLAMSDLFNAYQYFVGSYNFTDIITLFDNLRTSLQQETGSIESFITQYEKILNGIVDNVSVAFKLDNDRFRAQQMQMSLTLENAKAVSQLSNLVKVTTDFINTTLNTLIVIRDQIVNNVNGVNKNQIRNIVKLGFDSVKTSLGSVISKIISLNITDDINFVKQSVNQIHSREDLDKLLKRNLNGPQGLKALVSSFQQTFDTQLDGILSLVQFMFLTTTTDSRVYTPSALYNLRNLAVLNNFKNYRDVLLLILTKIITFITPADTPTDVYLSITSGNQNFYNLTGITVDQTVVDNVFIASVILDSRIESFDLMIQNIKVSIESVLTPMSKLTVLSRYVDPQRDMVDTYQRYDFSLVIPETADTIVNATQFTTQNYYEHKEQLQLLRAGTSQEALTAAASRGIRFERNKLRRSMLKTPIKWESDTRDLDPTTNTVQTYVGSELQTQLIKILTSTVPQHAWARYLGYRMIEEVGLIIDGEQIDMQDGDLMLLLHKMQSTVEHKRGDNIMLGHIPEMYTISSTPKPAMRLYVQFFLFFGKHYGNSLPLINMMYSDVKLKLKLRKFEDLFYMEQGAFLKRPVKMKFQLLGNYIYLGDEERKTCAITKSEALMERFVTSGTLVRDIRDLKSSILTDFGTAYNVLKIRYHYDDPCKYLLWKIQVEYPDAQPSDIVSWDLANYRVRHNTGTTTPVTADQLGVIDVKSQIINVVNRTLIEFNGKTREQWKDGTYFQILQPYNKCVNALDSGEALYAMCLFPRILQPSGATNLSQIEDLSFYFEINKQIVNLMKTTGVKIKITMWECSYNIFVAISGFGALRFYAVN